jgi:hypothetical protein
MAGWKECVQLMVVGEKRRCWVPQDLAYKGQAGKPTGTVVFDIELVDTRPSPTIPPPDVAEVPKDHAHGVGLAYRSASRRAPASGIPTPAGSGGALHGLDDRRQDVRQLGPDAGTHADAAR